MSLISINYIPTMYNYLRCRKYIYKKHRVVDMFTITSLCRYNLSSARCVYWNTSNRDWDTTGCTTQETKMRPNIVIVFFFHLSNSFCFYFELSPSVCSSLIAFWTLTQKYRTKILNATGIDF